MMKSRQTNRDSSRHMSDESEEDSDEKSPIRGRSGQMGQEVDEQIIAERSRPSNE